MTPIIHLRQNSLMILTFLLDQVGLRNSLDLLDLQDRLAPGWPPAPSPAGDRERVGPESASRERLPLRPSPPEPQLIPTPMNDGDDDQPQQEERQRRRSRSRERENPHAQVPQEPQTRPLVTPEADEVSDQDFSDMNPSSPATGPPPSAEQRRRSRRDERSRSRERTPPLSSSQKVDEDSATVDPQNRVSDRSRSPQEQEGSRRQGHQKQKGKKTVAEEQPSDLPSAKKDKPSVSDEDDEEPQNEPGASSNSQPTVPALPYNSGDEDSEYSDENSAQSWDSERTLFYTDLYVLTNDEYWTPETHKYAAAAGSFCVSMSESGKQQDICNLITMPCVQRSLYLNEVTNDFGNMKIEVPKEVDGQIIDMLEHCMATCGKAAGTRAKMRPRARKEASAQ